MGIEWGGRRAEGPCGSGMGEVERETLEWGKELCVLSTKYGLFSRMWKQRP